MKRYRAIGVILTITAILTIAACSGRSEENKITDGNRYMGRKNIDTDQTIFQNDENENSVRRGQVQRNWEDQTDDATVGEGNGRNDSEDPDEQNFSMDINPEREPDCDEDCGQEPEGSSEETQQRGKGRWAQESEDPLDANTDRGIGNRNGNGKKRSTNSVINA